MSLLEDVFLEDEAGEAQELERIIDGDEYEERALQHSDSNENSEREDEAEEDKRRVDPASTKTKQVVKNPRFVLNPARLTGPRGISVIPEHFKDFKFKGKGHEKEDLDLILKKLEHWAYRLYPKFKFEDCLKKIETLGKKRPVSVHLHKIRSDQLVTEDTVVQKDSSDEELAVPIPEEDEFDLLLKQQIELARATPSHRDMRPGFNTPVMDKRSPLMTPMMPKATSSPSISDEQRERMINNRKLAEERRLARLKAANSTSSGNIDYTVDLTNGIDKRNKETALNDDDANDVNNVSNESKTKRNKSNVIDSSDDDDNEAVNKPVSVDVHKTVDQNTVDLTESYNRHYIDSSHIENNENNSIGAPVIINLEVEFDALKSSNQNKIDLTKIQQGKSSFTANMETNETQNDEVEVIMTATAVEHSKIGTESFVDLTGITASANNIVNNETGIQKSNVPNSSDDDDVHISVINEDVVTDVHKANIIEASIRTVTSEPVKDNINDTQEKSNVCDADVFYTSNADANLSKEIEKSGDFEPTKENQDSMIEEPLNSNKGNVTKAQDVSNITEVENNKVSEENLNQEKVIESHNDKDEVLDDLMDVDFSEDF